MSLIAIAMYTKWTPCPQRASRLAMVENVWRRTNLLERLTYSLFLLSVSNLSSSIFPGVCPAWTSFSNLCFANITSTVAWLKYRTFARTVKRFRARADAYTNKESLREREGGRWGRIDGCIFSPLSLELFPANPTNEVGSQWCTLPRKRKKGRPQRGNILEIICFE